MPQILPDPPGVALIGGGFIGPVHAEALRRLGVPIIGLLGSSPERTRPLAGRLGIGRVYRDLDDLLADPAVGSVHVASPTPAHFVQARRCLEAGKHVVCEKPLAVRSTETGELVRLAAARPDLVAAVNYNVRFYPHCHEMRARVARGDVGRVLSVTGSYTQDWLLLPTDFNWRVEPDGGSNLRAVADIGTHWLDLARFVVDRPINSVFADLAIFHPERLRPVGPTETFTGPDTSGATQRVPIVTEDYGAVLLRWADGIHGAFHVSQAFAGRKNRLVLEVAGTEGALVWDSEEPDRLSIGRRGRPSESLPRDPSLLSPEASALAEYPGGHVEGFPDSFKALYRSIYTWIGSDRAGPVPFPTFADGDEEVRLCEAIARSAETGTWAEVPASRTGVGR